MLAHRLIGAGGDPIVLVGSASTQSTSTSSLVISKPTGTRNGDLLIAFMGASSSETWTGDTGWTEVLDQGNNGSPRIAYKVASSEPSSYTFTASTTTDPSGTVVAFRNARYDSIGSVDSDTSPLSPTAPSVTYEGSWLLGFGVNQNGGKTVEETGTMTTIYQDSDANGPSYLVAYEQVSAGSPGTRTFTLGSGNDCSAVLLVIKPI